MKILISLVMCFFAMKSMAQNDNNSFYKVRLKNGTEFKAQIAKSKRRKIFFENCTDLKNTSKNVRLNYIDTIQELSSLDSKSLINRGDSTPVLELRRMDNQNLKTKKIKENSYLTVHSNDSLRLKGKLIFVNKDTIRLNGKIIPMENIVLIKKPVKSAVIIGNTFGYLFTIVSLGLIESQGVEEGLTVAPLALPFYSLNFIKRRYNLETKWKAEVRFVKVKRRKN